MAFDRQFLDELIARNDIVDVVSNYVSLQPRGGSLWGCCPFNSEKRRAAVLLQAAVLLLRLQKRRRVINFIMERRTFLSRCGALSRAAREHARAGREHSDESRLRSRIPVAQPRRGALLLRSALLAQGCAGARVSYKTRRLL